ncbi:hypothetical protein AAZV13_20G144800 [Glycine max]
MKNFIPRQRKFKLLLKLLDILPENAKQRSTSPYKPNFTFSSQNLLVSQVLQLCDFNPAPLLCDFSHCHETNCLGQKSHICNTRGLKLHTCNAWETQLKSGD